LKTANEILVHLADTMGRLGYEGLAMELLKMTHKSADDIEYHLHTVSKHLRLVPLAKQVIEGKINEDEFTADCRRELERRLKKDSASP